MSDDAVPAGALLLWTARTRPGRGRTGEIAAVVFGWLCLAAILIVLSWVLFRQVQLILLGIVYTVAGLVRSVGGARGRVVLHPDALEVRTVRTRRYPWSTLRSVELVEGRIEITPDGWVRHLPVPAREAPTAYATLTAWRADHGV
ncbi:hypothetical protein FHX74_000737 [Friedmanniella endophytica]|uniref:PH domain-containing protein n=1 Tax=Microlunatus kandeliicorticis TaxID=1759536 RepID=A0A7W3IQ30_9ACTN|nr:PH domain-containing protein [Microlunatus kandeliicorticis]MBA8793143.1 hypothetical protein [Microlunatus kandeliicorticis]